MGRFLCHSTGQQKFQSNSQGKLTVCVCVCVAGRLQFLFGLLPCSATFHYSWQSQGKHNGKTVVQLPVSRGILSGKPWNGFRAQSWAGTSPGFRSSEGTNTESSQCHIQGAALGVRDKPGPGATSTRRVCLSWSPVNSRILSITESCPPRHCHS